MDQNVVLGQDSFVDDINNADSNNVTIRKGCCDVWWWRWWTAFYKNKR